MFSPGPRTTPTPWSAASSPIAAPILPSSSTSQLQAVVTAVGKQVAGRDSWMPVCSPRSSCLRKPWGPSHMNMDGIPYWGKPLVSQQFSPSHRAIFSSSVIFVFILALFYHPAQTPLFLPTRYRHIMFQAKLSYYGCHHNFRYANPPRLYLMSSTMVFGVPGPPLTPSYLIYTPSDFLNQYLTLQNNEANPGTVTFI